MFNAPSKTWINPYVVIKLFENTVKHNVSNLQEFRELIKKRKFKVTVEAWPAAIYLIAMSKYYNESHFFIQANPDDPPDFFGLRLFKKDNIVQGQELEIEVFQVPPESKLSVIEEIQKKVKKNYSKKTILICHIRNNKFSNTKLIHEEICKLNPNNEIWIIASANHEDTSKLIVSRIFPDCYAIKLDLEDLLNYKIENLCIEAKKGFQSELEFEHIGTMQLDPEFNLKEK